MDEKKKKCLGQIPDEVVCYILSKLELKEAAKTSVVAQGWKYLWSYAVTDLNFDASRRLPRLMEELDKDEMDWYVSWVNEVLKLLHVPTVEHFKVQFYLDRSCADDIDRWLRYAFERRVKRLELDFKSVISFYGKKLYPFPDVCNPIERMKFFPSGLGTLTTLESLTLKAVKVSSQVLEFFISNCPLLEQLSIEYCREVTHLRINGSSICLKHLSIYNCEEMTALEIHAPNLLSFEYFRPEIEETDIQVHNTKKLAKLTLYDASSSMLHSFRDCFTHLEELALNYTLPPQHGRLFEDGGLPRMKIIELRLHQHGWESLLDMARDLVYAAPHLEEFTIVLSSLYGSGILRQGQPADLLDANCRPHKFLKVVAIVGFAGSVVDTELAMFLSRIAISLEKMIFIPRLSYRDDQDVGWDFSDPEERNLGETARQLAQELKATLPSQTEVLIFDSMF